tara:strand:+ start:4045 stop:5241 length:1197 start_codon:yes stop_codon:yes gene_type:complete
MTKQNNKTVLWMSLLLAFVFSEIMVRHYLPEIGLALRKDELLGWANDEFQTFNPKAVPKTQKTKRILFLGDSFLAGSGLENLEQRFPDQLKKSMLPETEIHTLASGGWGTDQQLLAYLLKGRAWQPDLVVLAFCANNDLANILSNKHGTLPLKSYFVVDENDELNLYSGHGQPLDLINFTSHVTTGEKRSEGSYAFNLLTHHLKTTFFKAPKADKQSLHQVDKRYLQFDFSSEKPEELYNKQTPLTWTPQLGVNHVSAYIHEGFATNSYQWKLLKAILREFKGQVETNNAKFAILLLPVIFNPRDLSSIAGATFKHQYETKEGPFTFHADEPKKRLQKITQDLDIIFLDPTEAFIEEVKQHHTAQKIWSNPTDRHFNAKGHQILADLLADKIRRLVQD